MNTKREFNNRVYLNPELKEMFFALDLIESYGSGIRRAKDSMERNGSPEIVYEPINENDDYTMATAFINKEFVRIQAEEKGKPEGDITKTTAKTTTKTLVKILGLMRERPDITAEELAEEIGITKNGIRYHIKKLKSQGKIVRIGSSKYGQWKVFDE